MTLGHAACSAASSSNSRAPIKYSAMQRWASWSPPGWSASRISVGLQRREPAAAACYSEPVGNILNKGPKAEASVLESAEKVFAASNTNDATRLNAAKFTQAAVAELVRNLTKFGLTQVR